MDTKLKKNGKNHFEKLMINAVFGKTMKNVIKHIEI